MRRSSTRVLLALMSIVITAIWAPVVQADDGSLRATLEQIRCSPRRVHISERHDHSIAYAVDCWARNHRAIMVVCRVGRCDVQRSSPVDQE
jgi:hypothetical protein